MIIYQNNIQGFINDCQEPNLLVAKISAEMKQKLGWISGKSERDSWESTLAGTKKIFNHLKVKNKQYILLEYKIPYTQKRIDIIVCGENTSQTKFANACLIELKGWSYVSKKTQSKLLNINTRYRQSIHPSYQVDEYLKSIKNQLSDVEKIFRLYALAYLPNFKANNPNPLQDVNYQDVISKIKSYSQNDQEELISFLEEKFNKEIHLKKVKFLAKLEYKPSTSFSNALKNDFKNIQLKASQVYAYEKIVETIQNHLDQKQLIIVSGMAGSGKTIVAFKLLAYLLTKGKKTDLQLPGVEFRDVIKKKFTNNIIVNFITGAYANTPVDYLIIDEAHKAYANWTGKTYYNILFKKTNFVITLIDDFQAINKKSVDKQQLTKIAKNNNFNVIDLNLEEQYRNGGDASYNAWLKYWIFDKRIDETKLKKGLQVKFVKNYFQFEILSVKKFNQKYNKMYAKHKVRLASFWTQTWNLKYLTNGLPTPSVKIGNSKYTWNPNWQWLTKFRFNNPKVKINSKLDKLCNFDNFNDTKKGAQYIAYFNTIQGSEFEYIFVHIPKLFFLNQKNELDVDLDQLQLREMQSQVWVKNKGFNDLDQTKIRLNKQYFKNRLFVNLTRATKGAFVYIENPKLRNWLKNKIINPINICQKKAESKIY